ncbi:MAG: cupin domain-containing protein [Candidatus Marinimicrobia bacterium]|nr:cupin domain-containing protein [Candidatus Neomarinimicrobiota bacterium]
MKKTLIVLLLIGMLTALFAVGSEGKTEVKVLAKTSQSWNGDNLPRYSKGKPEVTILRISIPPHTDLAWHEHPEINAGVMISGELTVITDKQDTLHLQAGDPIVEVVDTWHFGKNEGNEPVDIIVFYAGIKGKAVTILEDTQK